jgi:hypothetical protein
MDTLARLHFDYVVEDELRKKGFSTLEKVKEAAKKYNDCLNGHFDRLEDAFKHYRWMAEQSGQRQGKCE